MVDEEKEDDGVLVYYGTRYNAKFIIEPGQMSGHTRVGLTHTRRDLSTSRRLTIHGEDTICDESKEALKTMTSLGSFASLNPLACSQHE